MYVLFISGALILTALVYAFLSLRKPDATPDAHGEAADEGPASWIVLAVFGVVAAYGFLIPLIGYMPSTVLFLLAQFRLLGVQSWVRNGLITIAVSAAFYVVFIYYGGMVFPHGGLLE
jgi:putative tricarboxylic transport membrane protein